MLKIGAFGFVLARLAHRLVGALNSRYTRYTAGSHPTETHLTFPATLPHIGPARGVDKMMFMKRMAPRGSSPETSTDGHMCVAMLFSDRR